MKTILGFFSDLARAEHTLQELHRLGVRRKDLNLVASGTDDEVRPYFDHEGRYHLDRDHHGEMGPDDTVGASLAGIGGLLSIGLFSIPAVGPILAAGPLALAAAGGALGAESEGLHGFLIDVGVPEGVVDDYTAAVRRGSVLLVARVPEELRDRTVNMMERLGGSDLESQRARWADAEAEGSTSDVLHR